MSPHAVLERLHKYGLFGAEEDDGFLEKLKRHSELVRNVISAEAQLCCPKLSQLLVLSSHTLFLVYVEESY
jgi:hypothetical protein